MFSHIVLGTNDFPRALAFWRPVMMALGVTQRFVDESRPWAGWQTTGGPRPLLVLGRPFDGQPATPGNGQMVALLAPDRATVDRAHATALAHGGRCEGPPGLRPQYHADYYGAYFRDPDGNKIGVACHTPQPAGARPNPSVRITRLDVAHVEPYRDLMLHAYAAAPDAFTATPDERAAQPLSWWLARLGDAQAHSQTFGAHVAGELAGVATVEFSQRPKTRHKAGLIAMYVHKPVRGLGVGRLLVRAALEAAAARPGVQVVTLTVTEGNAPALALYQRCGFQPFGVEPMAIASEGGFKSKVHMWCKVGAGVAVPAPG